MEVMDAVSAPRVHHQWLPDELWVEPEISVDTRGLLGALGHQVVVKERWGGGNSIQWDPIAKVWLGAFDPRKEGASLGY
jgi:gamma-glutamyltranspeptidase/glutathione hydrolase